MEQKAGGKRELSYAEMLEESAQRFGSIVCMGADPVLERIPIREGDAEKKISGFYRQVLEAAEAESVLPAAVKPNYAFYAQYGFPGLRALKKVCEMVKGKGIPLVLDAKRGDIGKTNAAYAREAFEFWEADCVTLSPFLGSDSIAPFAEWCRERGKGAYVLNRTSNPSASELQDLECGGKKVYMILSEKIVEWGKGTGGMGAVVGATSPKEFEKIVSLFAESKADSPLLIPGVGAQGGSAGQVAEAMRKAGYRLGMARINSSSGINYAYEKQGTDDFAGAAVKAIKKLNSEIGSLE